MKSSYCSAGLAWRATLLVMCLPFLSARAQISPGPYEVLPFEDGFIIEAFFDLIYDVGGNNRADWTGYSGTTWISPNAYNNHRGTDIAVQTGTPLYAAVAGTVTEVVTHFPKNDHSTPYGNFVRIAVDAPTPNGESIDLLYLHMLTVTATNGQRVSIGDQVGLSDNTGNSTSEHLHIQSEIRGGSPVCPFYWGHFKFPIMFNATANHQIGRVVRVTANSTVIRTDHLDSSTQISTAHEGQLFFSSYPKRGYYRVFIPNNGSNRSGWIRADQVEEVFIGTVIQAMPDNVTYVHSGQLQTKYSIRSTPNDGASQLGQVLFGGGRFVADQITNGYYRIPLPGASATWGWVKPNNRMIVYPELIHPAINTATLPTHDFPIQESFSELGKSMFGRPKFTRSVVKSFTPSSPGGDGKALFVTDANNSGNGYAESVLVGKPGHRNYFVQCDVYFNYNPAYLGSGRWERYGIFLRDDGFAGMTDTFEGGGHCYAIVWDNDDGRLRAGYITNATVVDLQSSSRYEPASGWRTMRIEARTNQIRFLLDGELLAQVNNTIYPAGQTGMGYRWHAGNTPTFPAARGAYFDNFLADTLDPVPFRFKQFGLEQDGKMRFLLSGALGSTSLIERASILAPTNWVSFTNIVNSNSIVEFHDDGTNSPCQFYRAKKL
ncbi:MAG: M23 family metallopeptidase [Verrucomicrobia bacterium]|nr:M23 family metallopeptidase [Verrucomicrobiota bacterium]